METLVPEQIDPTNATIEEIGAHQACSSTQAYYPLTQTTPQGGPNLSSAPSDNMTYSDGLRLINREDVWVYKGHIMDSATYLEWAGQCPPIYRGTHEDYRTFQRDVINWTDSMNDAARYLHLSW